MKPTCKRNKRNKNKTFVDIPLGVILQAAAAFGAGLVILGGAVYIMAKLAEVGGQ